MAWILIDKFGGQNLVEFSLLKREEGKEVILLRSKLKLRQNGRTVLYRKAIRAKRFSESGVMTIRPEEAGLSRDVIDREMHNFIERTRNATFM